MMLVYFLIIFFLFFDLSIELDVKKKNKKYIITITSIATCLTTGTTTWLSIDWDNLKTEGK